MSNLKCPFCQQELKYESEVYVCRNPNCKHLLGFGTKELWQELICTHKALDVAVDALDASRTLARIAGFEMLATGMDEAIDKITTLEPKDVK